MADAALQFLLEHLTHLLNHRIELISNIKSDVEKLLANATFFKSFLQMVSKKKLRKNETLRKLVGEIRSVIYDAEDVMDAYVTQAAEKKTKTYFTGGARLIDIANKVNNILDGINKIYGDKDKFDLVNFAIDDGEDEKPVQPILRQANVVGLEDEVDKIVGYLNEETGYVDVISIVGMPGLGKTTLAGKIFHDNKIESEFPISIWVYVSSEFKEKEVFLSILRQLKTKLDEDEYGKKKAGELAEEIAKELDRGAKFLLVMDDVWEPKDWEKLKVVLPKHNTRGKVMITSRHVTVGNAAKVGAREPHKLRPMNLDESCKLLQWEVFNKPEFPAEFKKVGEEIAKKCGGLPLAIVVIGGVLKTKYLGSASWWEKVSRSVPSFIDDNDSIDRMDDVISMSYQKLPYHLKECFLYLGMFPEDFEIPAWKLIRMWIAEGLIESKGSITMEERGESYLEELISRNLIKLERLNSDGSVKTCRMHDMLGAFCKRQGGKGGENFLQEIKESGDGGLQFLVEKERRLCIHSNVVGFLSNTTKGASVRSFVTFSNDIEIPKDKISAIFQAFKLLRVLEAKPLKFRKIPGDFYHLIHLRYLVLSLNLDNSAEPASLPSAFEKLWNLQTLVVETTSRELVIRANIMKMAQLKHVKSNASITLDKESKIKANIMKMAQLTHVKSNASITLDKGSKNKAKGEKLQTLCNMRPGSCPKEILGMASNLKKVGIRGAIGSFVDGTVGSVDSLSELTKLEKLKLWNDVFPNKPSSGKLDSLPIHYKFPPALKSLTLVATYLDWTNMSVLALLENLQVLKLKENACMGSKWTVGQEGFNSLKFLHITRTDLETWEATARHFPMLKRLELHNCEKLKTIPIALADIPQFQHLELKNSKEAASSASNIDAKAKRNVHTFKLSIL